MSSPIALQSLKTRITLSTAAIFLVGIWSLAFYASGIVRDDLQRAMSQQQQSTAAFVAAAINQELDERMAMLETAAKLITPAILADTGRSQALLAQFPILQMHFSGGIFVTRRDGTAIASLPLSRKRTGINYLDHPHIARALTEGKSSVGEPTIGKVVKVPLIGVAAPVLAANGEVIGALIGAIDLNTGNLFRKIAANRYGQTGGYVLVEKAHRLVITATEHERAMEALPAPGAQPLLDRFLGGYEGSGLFLDNQGLEVLASAKGVPSANWYVMVSLPTGEAFATIRDMQVRVVVIAICLSLLSGLLTWWLLSRQLSPMLAAVDALASISDLTQTTQPIPVIRDDEIGRLIGGFNRLLERLAEGQTALTESEFRWKFAIEGTGDGLWDWDITSRTVFFSRRWKEMLGFGEEELSNRLDEWDLRLHPDDKPKTMVALQTCLDGKSAKFESEYRFLCKDGSYKWILDRGVVVSRNDQGQPLRMIGTHGDITQRRQADQHTQKLLLAVEQSPNSIVITDTDGRIEYVNDAFVGHSGYDREEVIGQNPRILQSGNTPIATFVAMWSALTKGLPWKGEFLNRRKNGEQYTESAAIAPLRQSDGSITHFVAVKEDVTAQRRMASELTRYQAHLEELMAEQTGAVIEKNALLQRLVDTIPFGAYRVRHIRPGIGSSPELAGSPRAQLEMVSARCCEILGVSESEAQLKLSSAVEYIHPEDRDEYARLNLEANVACKAFAWEGRIMVGDTYQWLRIDSTPHVTEEAVIWSGIVQRIGERRHRNSLIYRSVIEASYDAFVAIDEDDRITEWSPQAERIFGWTLADILGKSLTHTIIPPALAGEHRYHLRDFVNTGRDGAIGPRRRLTAIKRDGTEFPIELRIMALQIDGHWRFTSFIRDITDDLYVESQLLQAQKLEAISHLSSGLAHDFNNILGIIIGNLDLLGIDIPPGEPREMLAAAMSAAQRGTEVTKSLLAVARRSALNPNEMDLNHLIHELEPLLRHTAGKRIQLTVTTRAEPAWVSLDSGSFNNALLNIVINARDAMPSGGELLIYCYSMQVERPNQEVSTLEPGSYVVVGVDDTGPGMTPEVAAQVFDPFFTTKGRDKGTGLGLAMVFGFAHQSGGTARILSAPGKGTSVQLILPERRGVSRTTPIESETSHPTHYPMTAEGRRRILIVDDESALLKLNARRLSDLGYAVTTAGDAAAAAELLTHTRFDLMLTDIIMPGEVDGLELARTSAILYPAMRILLTSGFSESLSDDDRARWVLLPKPVSREAMSDAVATAFTAAVEQEPVKLI